MENCRPAAYHTYSWQGCAQPAPFPPLGSKARKAVGSCSCAWSNTCPTRSSFAVFSCGPAMMLPACLRISNSPDLHCVGAASPTKKCRACQQCLQIHVTQKPFSPLAPAFCSGKWINLGAQGVGISGLRKADLHALCRE